MQPRGEHTRQRVPCDTHVHSRGPYKPLWPGPAAKLVALSAYWTVATQRLQAEGLAPPGSRSRATNGGGQRTERGTGRCQPRIDPQSAPPWSQQARRAAFAVARQTRGEEAKERRPARSGIACSDVCKQASEDDVAEGEPRAMAAACDAHDCRYSHG